LVIPPFIRQQRSRFIAQADQLGVESAAFVDELTAALEEIDAAARSVGCW